MISLGLPKSHFFLKLSQNEKASEASGATKTKASLGSITSTPAFRKKNWKRSKNSFDFHKMICERKGLITTKFHFPDQK